MKSSESRGLIFDIDRFGIHDGPGIRTVIFLKGCSLRCLWCHNPEGQSPRPELFFYKERCLKCGACVRACPIGAVLPTQDRMRKKVHAEKCTLCGKCVEACFVEALTLTGRYYTVPEVIAEAEKNRAFYRKSAGGITISGGEPLLQDRFVYDLVKECRSLGIHTALETTGFLPWQRLEKIVPFIDLFLYDLKHLDSQAHRAYTGQRNEVILGNVKKIDSYAIPIIFRIPVITGYTDGLQNLKETAQFCTTIRNVKRVDLLPYNPMGESKYTRLGRAFCLKALKPPATAEMEETKQFFESFKLEVQIGG